MQTIDQESLVTVTGGNNVDTNLAGQCAARTAANATPAGAIIGGAMGGVATGGAGIVPGAVLGARVGGVVGSVTGWLGSIVSQFFGGNPCPTAPASPPSSTGTTARRF
ncbi:MAG: hypothetical protein AB7T06_46405 [Kofleriaceae bacterium]